MPASTPRNTSPASRTDTLHENVTLADRMSTASTIRASCSESYGIVCLRELTRPVVAHLR